VEQDDDSTLDGDLITLLPVESDRRRALASRPWLCSTIIGAIVLMIIGVNLLTIIVLNARDAESGVVSARAQSRADRDYMLRWVWSHEVHNATITNESRPTFLQQWFAPVRRWSALSQLSNEVLEHRYRQHVGCARFCGPLSSLAHKLHASRARDYYCVDVTPDGVTFDEALNAECLLTEKISGRMSAVVDFLSQIKPRVSATLIVDTLDQLAISASHKEELYSERIRTVAFCDSCYSAQETSPFDGHAILIPDMEFLSSAGYDAFKAQIDLAAAASPFSSKTRKITFRGSTTGNNTRHSPTHLSENARLRVSIRSREKCAGCVPENFDISVSSIVQVSDVTAAAIVEQGLIGDHMTSSQMMQSRAILDMDGNSNSWRGCWWKLRSNSVVIKEPSQWCQWYYPRLVPFVHFIPLSDLQALGKWVADDANVEQMVSIANAATTFTDTLTVEDAREAVRSALRPPLFSFFKRIRSIDPYPLSTPFGRSD
jgi:hypothetical protein